MRRIYTRPAPLPPPPQDALGRPDDWLQTSWRDGPVVRAFGPYVVAGGWWSGAEVRREMAFAETTEGRIAWVYFDRRRRCRFLHGRVE